MRLDGDVSAFGSSWAFLAGMLSSAAFGIFPWVLPRFLYRKFSGKVNVTASVK
jgi:hypothetical protein